MANPNPNWINMTSSKLHSFPSSSSTPRPQPPPVTLADDEAKSSRNNSFLTRRDVLSRRSARLKRLARSYRSQYWMLMEELRKKHREYIWLYGKSPFETNNDSDCGVKAETEMEKTEVYTKCGLQHCKVKAMAFTKFCHTHILSDEKQVLYVGCSYSLKSGHTTCGKPVLRSTVPSYCSDHFPQSEGFLFRALRRQGHIVSPSSKVSPDIYLLFKEYVSQVQMTRRAVKRNTSAVKNESMEE